MPSQDSPDNRGKDPRARTRPPDARRIVLGALVLVALVVAALWALSTPDPPRGVVEVRGGPAGSGVGDASGRIVGDGACRECHPIEAGQHGRSGHANTLRPAVATELARWLDGRRVDDPERPGVDWSYSLRDGALVAERSEGARSERATLEFALGSGRHATTFVTTTPAASGSGSPGSREHRLTYFARDRSLGLTPAQKASEHAPGLNPLGRDRNPGETVHCFGCHSTTVSSFSPQFLDVATLRPNVGCERCHGPGEAHIEAARRGKGGTGAGVDLSMPFGKVWTAEGQMQLCGDCHRHPSQAPPGEIRPDNVKIVRFQPVGLMQSACYTKSDGALSCVNCHDPHARSSPDRPSYEAACLSCHTPGTPKRHACPVSPRTDCIRCHMPAVDTGQGIPFTDHWIRIRKDP